MEIGVDSFAAMFSGNSTKVINDADAMTQLLDRIENADHARSGHILGLENIIAKVFSILHLLLFWLQPLPGTKRIRAYK